MFDTNSQTSNIRNISISEVDDGASVELVLADASELDDAEESLVLSVRVQYGNPYPHLGEVKLWALDRARDVIAAEMRRYNELHRKHTF